MPPSRPVPTHHLGGGGGTARPVRAPLVAVLVGLLAVVAIPVYLWRRPKPAVAPSQQDLAAASAAVSAFRTPPDPSQALVEAALDGGVQAEHVTLGAVRWESCYKGRTKLPSERCDRIPFFEQALVKAILDGVECAPTRKQGGSISYALKIDFARKRIRLFAGKSGTLRKNDAKPSVDCVEKKLVLPAWQTIPHECSSYLMAVLATYPGAE